MATLDENGYIESLDKNDIFVFGSNGQGAHNNIQPYITVYMWRRTA